MADMTCLAEGVIFPADFAKTGVNLNEIVVGPTGCGKSFSNAYSRLLHTTDSSVVVPIAKKALRDKFQKLLVKRGYKVINLDFAHPENSLYGYDPLDFVDTDNEVIQTARNLICGGSASRSRNGEMDPYWNDSATSVLAAEIMLVRLTAMESGRRACFGDVVDLHRSLKINESGSCFKSNLDPVFEAVEKRYPGNQAPELWKTIKGLASKTASCILSIVNSALDKIFCDSVVAMTKKDRRVDFKELGDHKTALFITTSPMNQTLQSYINMLYADMFRELFEAAEERDDSRLQVPVHIICDDFACGGKINDFEEYISIFRAAGISVTMLLQSESQLNSMYGEGAATTIINNCDTYVYMGGMDITTCRNISQRTNKPLTKVMSMPLEKVIVFRRGMDPIYAKRYQTTEDELYKQMMEEQDDH